MRSTSAALAAVLLLAAAAPAAAQVCDCAPGAFVEDGPATVVVPRTTFVPHTRYAARSVMVPRTRLVPRVVYVPRTHYVRRSVVVPQTVYTAHTSTVAYPAYGPLLGAGYPAWWNYGATYVPPGAAYGCTLGTVGCDSSFVGPIGY